MWRITLTRKFAKDLAKLPPSIRRRVEALIRGEEIRHDPYLAGRSSKMSGYNSFYRVRIGDYRVGFRLDEETQTVKLLRVLHRREIYRRFP